MKTSQQKLIAVLQETRELITRPENDFSQSSWKDSTAALRELDILITHIQSNELPPRSNIEVLFLPTGPLQEVSVCSGWGKEFLALASRCDIVLQSVYGLHPRDVAAHKAELAGQFHQLFGGSIRWICTVLFILSVGFLIHMMLTKETIEVYFPIHLKGQGVWWALLFAATIFGILAIINWISHLRMPSKTR